MILRGYPEAGSPFFVMSQHLPLARVPKRTVACDTYDAQTALTSYLTTGLLRPKIAATFPTGPPSPKASDHPARTFGGDFVFSTLVSPVSTGGPGGNFFAKKFPLVSSPPYSFRKYGQAFLPKSRTVPPRLKSTVSPAARAMVKSAGPAAKCQVIFR